MNVASRHPRTWATLKAWDNPKPVRQHKHQISHQSLERARSRVKFPSLNVIQTGGKMEHFQMHHRMTKGPQSGMSSKKSLQDAKHTHFTKSSSRKKDTEETSTVQASSESRVPTVRRIPRTTCSRQWLFVTHDWASVNKKEKKTIYSTNKQHPDTQTANGIVASDTQAKVGINELGAYQWVHWWEIHHQCSRWED